jgi:hypothetical protein
MSSLWNPNHVLLFFVAPFSYVFIILREFGKVKSIFVSAGYAPVFFFEVAIYDLKKLYNCPVFPGIIYLSGRQ